MGNSPNFQEIRDTTIQKRNQNLDKFIPKFEEIIKVSKITPQRIDELTRLDLVGLVSQLNKLTVTSEQLIAIYGLRAATIGRRNCIITEDYFEYALKRATECDNQRAKTGKRNWTMDDEWDMNKFFPPLFGIPTSIKENIQIEGTRSTIGLTIRATRYDKQDCGTIKCMKNSGLIPFIKTNLPQLAFNFDSANFLWGRTLNPWNPNKSAGGSSGGQGAAIATRVSPIGIGNDMGGSIRIPAAFNGVVGLMVSANRLPSLGQMAKYSTGFSGLDTIKAVNGPLSNSIDSIALWLRQMTLEQYYQGDCDPYKKLIPFDYKLYKQVASKKETYRIGYFDTLQLIEPTLANRRAVKQTVHYLTQQGHKLVEITIPDQNQLIFKMFGQLVGEGEFKTFIDMLEGQDLAEQYRPTAFVTNRSWAIFNCLKCFVNSKYPRLGQIMQASRRLTTHQYLENAGWVNEYRGKWIKFWRDQKLDFLICPAFATEALNHKGSKDGSILAAYTFIFNLLSMVSCTLPITVTRADQLHYQSDWEDPITQLIRECLKDSEGLPIGIQVVGMPFNEQRVLGLCKRIQQHFKFSQKHPLPKTD